MNSKKKRGPPVSLAECGRLTELERAFFPPITSPRSQTKGEGFETTVPTVPLLPSLDQSRQQTPSQKRNKGSPRRARHLNAACFGFNPLNPFESVVEAAPAITHLQPHSWQQLELQPPPGCSTKELQALKADLDHHLRTSTNPGGARVNCTPQNRPLAYGSLPPQPPAAATPTHAGALNARISQTPADAQQTHSSPLRVSSLGAMAQTPADAQQWGMGMGERWGPVGDGSASNSAICDMRNASNSVAGISHVHHSAPLPPRVHRLPAENAAASAQAAAALAPVHAHARSARTPNSSRPSSAQIGTSASGSEVHGCPSKPPSAVATTGVGAHGSSPQTPPTASPSFPSAADGTGGINKAANAGVASASVQLSSPPNPPPPIIDTPHNPPLQPAASLPVPTSVRNSVPHPHASHPVPEGLCYHAAATAHHSGMPAGGVNGPRAPLASSPFSAKLAGNNTGGWAGNARSINQSSVLPALGAMEPAGIGSGGAWAARRGMPLSGVNTSSSSNVPYQQQHLMSSNSGGAPYPQSTVSNSPAYPQLRGRDGELLTAPTPKGVGANQSIGQSTLGPASPTVSGGAIAGPPGCVPTPHSVFAGFGPGVTSASAAAAGGALPAGSMPGGPPVTLGALMTERQSVRRQAQLIGEWLDTAVARIWNQHTELVAELSMRAALANKQGAALMEYNGSSTAALDSTDMAALAAAARSSMGTPLSGAQNARTPQGQPDFGPVGDAQSEGNGVERMTSTAQHSTARMPAPTREGVRVQQQWGGPDPTQAAALQQALSTLMGATAKERVHAPDGAKKADPIAAKQDLAARFASFVQGSMLAARHGDGVIAEASHALWKELLMVVSAASTALVQHVGEGCWEEGALLARLWNLHATLLTSGVETAHCSAARAESEAEQLRSQIKRLDPLIEWDKSAQQELLAQREVLADQGALLHLASSERDALLRENDKIIGHYKKELRRVRHEQRRGQWRLAKKLKLTQDQLVLMQRDRQSMLDAVTYTRGQAFNMVGVMHSVNKHFQRLQANHKDVLETEGFSMNELLTIEDGLRSMAATAARVQEVNKEAEDQHFQMEEQVTAVAAKDDYADDEVEAIMAGGDPDKPDEEVVQKAQPEQEPSESSDHEEELAREEEQRVAEEQAKKEEEERAAAAQQAEKEREEQEAANAESEAASQAAQAAKDAETAKAEQEAAEAAAAAQAAAEFDAAQNKMVQEVQSPTRTSPSSQGSRSRTHSRQRSRAVAMHDVGMQTVGQEQNNRDQLRAQEHRVESLLRARENDLAVRLMDEFGIEMDEELLQLHHIPSLPSSRAASPLGGASDHRRSPLPHARSNMEQSRLGRLHSGKDDQAPAFTGGAFPSQQRHARSKSMHSQNSGDGRRSIYEDSESMDEEKPSLLRAVAERIQEKLEEAQADVQRSPDPFASRPDSPEATAEAATKLDVVMKDLKEAREQLKASKATNRDLETQVKEANKAAAKLMIRRETATESEFPAVVEPKAGAQADKEAARKATAAAPQKDRPRSNRGARNVSLKEKGKLRHRNVVSPDQNKREPPTPAPTEQAKPPKSEGFLLGKERDKGADRERLHHNNSARLEDAIAKYAGIKPRTPEWLLKIIDGIYKGKMLSDEARAKMVPPQEPMPLVDYMFQHFTGMYGTSSLVNQYAALLVATIKANLQADVRVKIFNHFLMEDRWPRKVLTIFLDALKRLGEPARLPCCDFPVDFSGTKKGGHPLADVRKCLWVADKVLMRRHTRTAYNFAAALALKGEPIPDNELHQYFVAPGFYGQELQQMLEYEKGRAEFRKIPTHMFLEALCDEYTRCEKVFMDVLPGLHKKWDTNADGYLSWEDVTKMMKHMASQDTTEEDAASETLAFWRAAYKNEVGDIETSATVAARQSVSSLADQPDPTFAPKETDGLIGIDAFVSAAQHSNYIRRYVRLHKTPPSRKEITSALSPEARARLLLRALIDQQWKVHLGSLSSIFPQTGPSMEALLREQVANLASTTDGARKAILLHGVFKMLIARKLNSLVSQLPSENTGTHEVDKSFPDTIHRLTIAVKVLYGADVLVADDLRQQAKAHWEPGAAKGMGGMQQSKIFADAFRVYNSLRTPMRIHATRYLSSNPWLRRFCFTKIAATTGRIIQDTKPISPQSEKGASRASSVHTLATLATSQDEEEASPSGDARQSRKGSRAGLVIDTSLQQLPDTDSPRLDGSAIHSPEINSPGRDSEVLRGSVDTQKVNAAENQGLPSPQAPPSRDWSSASHASSRLGPAREPDLVVTASSRHLPRSLSPLNPSRSSSPLNPDPQRPGSPSLTLGSRLPSRGASFSRGSQPGTPTLAPTLGQGSRLPSFSRGSRVGSPTFAQGSRLPSFSRGSNPGTPPTSSPEWGEQSLATLGESQGGSARSYAA